MKSTQKYQKITKYEAGLKDAKKIVLLYSGSTYTSVLIPWLKKTYKADVISLIVDIGQRGNIDNFRKLSQNLGALKTIVIDAKERFAKEYLVKAIKANVAYQRKSHLVSPMSRPLLAKLALEVAEKEGASAIAHGCSAQSNDQVRIDSIIISLNPDIKIISPLRDESLFKGEAVKLARSYKIPQEYITEGYSYDDNLWGAEIIGQDIENTHVPSRIEHLLKFTLLPEKASEIAERITIDFEKGIPVGLNNKRANLVELISSLNKIGGNHGIGISYNIEDTLFGLKGRSIEEQPAAEILIVSHQELEKYVSTGDENEFIAFIDNRWSYMCYGGKWLEPLMSALDAFIDNINKKVTGRVTLRLFKGNVEIISIQTPKTIQEKKLAMFANKGIVNHKAIASFIEISSMPMQLANRPEKTILLTIGKRSNKFKLLSQLKKLDKNIYKLYATYKTHKFLKTQGIDAVLVNKIHQSHLKPNLIDLLDENRFDLIIRIPSGKNPTKKEQRDSEYILKKAQEQDIPLITSIEEAEKILETL